MDRGLKLMNPITGLRVVVSEQTNRDREGISGVCVCVWMADKLSSAQLSSPLPSPLSLPPSPSLSLSFCCWLQPADSNCPIAPLPLSLSDVHAPSWHADANAATCDPVGDGMKCTYTARSVLENALFAAVMDCQQHVPVDAVSEADCGTCVMF